jgi:hypothetical protein
VIEEKEEIPGPLFCNRRGAPRSKNALGDDFRAISPIVFIEEPPKLTDVSRSPYVCIIEDGGASDGARTRDLRRDRPAL